ncbi:MAG: HAD-IA family hydrolase [Anaerolineales bacterium]|nr:HAD-IA family hydrolase [Anaerolineales bacterium]
MDDRVLHKRKFKAVIFDLDGTLIASKETARLALGDLLRKHNREAFSDEISQSFRGMPTRQILSYIDPEQVDSLLLEVVELENYYRDRSSLYAGTLETLRALDKAQIQLAVVTSQAALEVEHVRAYFPLDDMIQVWVSADDILHPKPHPESLEKAMDRMMVAKEQTLFVGDTHYDIMAGKLSGVHTGAALWGRNNAHDLLALDPDFLFNDPAEIQELCLP